MHPQSQSGGGGKDIKIVESLFCICHSAVTSFHLTKVNELNFHSVRQRQKWQFIWVQFSSVQFQLHRAVIRGSCCWRQLCISSMAQNFKNDNVWLNDSHQTGNVDDDILSILSDKFVFELSIFCSFSNFMNWTWWCLDKKFPSFLMLCHVIYDVYNVLFGRDLFADFCYHFFLRFLALLLLLTRLLLIKGTSILSKN